MNFNTKKPIQVMIVIRKKAFNENVEISTRRKQQSKVHYLYERRGRRVV